jgi:hypothetical protein
MFERANWAQPERERIVWELAKELHRDRGTETWGSVSDATRRRWAKRAESLIARCPTLNRAIGG